MWPPRAAVFLLCFTGCWGQSCNGTKAYFESRNFFSVLHWDPVDVPGQTVLYSVQYNTYGHRYKPVTWCQNISTPVCDMTDVMTHVMSDVSTKYHAKVSAGGRCLGEVVFAPFWETTFTAPQLSVTSNQTYLNVTVSPPMAAWNCSIENINFWGKGLLRSSVKYTVRLTHPKSQAGKVTEDTSRSVFIWLKETDEQYCGEVFYTLTHPGLSSPSENAPFCVNVSAHNSWLHILIWPGLLALLLLIVLPIMLCQLPVKGKSFLPNALILKSNSPPFCAVSHDDISKVEVCSRFDLQLKPQAVFHPLKSKVAGNNAYASQGPCDQEWTCDQPDIPVQDSPGSSVHYSMCVPVQTQPSSHGTTDEPSSDSFGPNFISLIDQSDSGSNSGPLVVPVISTKDGALQFHHYLFQRESGQNSPAPSQDSGEQTPLLPDPAEKDSRCISSYLPVHVSNVITSNYRQNWLPGIPLEGQKDQRTYVMRTNHLQDSSEPNEDFTDEEEPRVGVIFLDRWMLEMQGLTLSCN